MPDDKSKRGSPDNKRLNKSEPYEVAYARKKAATRAAAPRASATRTSAGRADHPATLDGSTPRPSPRSPKRSAGTEKNVTNTTPAAARREPDAVDLLVDDHLAANACFKKYKKLVDADASAATKRELSLSVCRMLTLHTHIEEEIFYPAARQAGIDKDLLDEADIEHASAKELIRQIESSSADDDHYDAKVTVLGEYIQHHVVEEHTELFLKCRRSDMDLAGLRVQMEARKAELEAQLPNAEAAKPGLLERVSSALSGDR